MGKSVDDPSRKARRILAFMLRPLMGAPSFVCRLFPVYELTSGFLLNAIRSIIQSVHSMGGIVFALMCDNHKVNQAAYRSIAKEEEPWLGHHPAGDFPLFLLYDTIHLFKNIRNNWITEKTRTLTITINNENLTGKWADLVSLYDAEKNAIVRRSSLNFQAVHPSILERQKVSLVFNVFSDKTVAALQMDGRNQTAEFISVFRKLLKILNVKTPFEHIHLNDKDRAPFTSNDDSRFNFIQSVILSIDAMPSCKGNSRQFTLTSDTRSALKQTLIGLQACFKYLIDNRMPYILSAVFQSDPLEGEFGIYRQMCGGNYYISVEEVYNSLKLQRMKLYQKLKISPTTVHVPCEMCTSDLTDKELASLDDIWKHLDDLTVNEKNTLFYICGFVCKTLGMGTNHQEQTSTSDSVESEFCFLLSRGLLTVPPEPVFNYSVFCYSVFRSICSEQNCFQRTVRLFLLVYDCYDFNFSNHTLVAAKLTNTFYNGLIHRTDDFVPSILNLQDRRKRKLTN